MQKLDKFDVKIGVLPNGLEKYMAFTINKNLVFIDSMKFMNSSLDTLIKNLSDNNFKHLSQEFTGEYLKLVKRKRVYPHDYMDSIKTFSNEKLPNRCKFFSSLKDECLSQKDYLHVTDVWIMFKMRTMCDYHDLYLKTDFLLLADIFEKFNSNV